MSYHVTGLISSLFFLLAIIGIWDQLGVIWSRKVEYFKNPQEHLRPTAVLSLNRFITAFFAYYCFFSYGLTLTRFNHYFVWPRLVALSITLAILYELMSDRKTIATKLAFWICLAATLLLPLAVVYLDEPVLQYFRKSSQLLFVVMSVLLAQSYFAQILEIRRKSSTGAISIRAHQFCLVKDLSTICFAITMGFAAGWPALLISSVSFFNQLSILWQFRWVKKRDTVG